MFLLSAISWIANAFIIAGMWGVGYRWRPALLLSVFGNVLWTVVGLMRGDVAIAALATVMAGLSLRAWANWAKI